MSDLEQSASPQNGTRSAFVVLAALLAIVTGVYAMVEPMGQRIDFLAEELAQLRSSMAIDDTRETRDQREAAAMVERFTEVETQFRGLREVVDVRLTHLESDAHIKTTWINTYDAEVRGRNAAERERIKSLERVVYGSSGESRP